MKKYFINIGICLFCMISLCLTDLSKGDKVVVVVIFGVILLFWLDALNTYVRSKQKL